MGDSEQSSPDAQLSSQSVEIRASLIRLFKRRGVPPQDIEDLVQEVFVRLAKRGTGGIDNLGGYALQTGASVLVDRGRRRAVRHEDAQVELLGERHPAEDIGPDRIVAGRQELGIAVASLMTLPERTRIIFVLRRVEGLRYRDIAARLGISVSAVEKHMTRAVEHLLSGAGDRS